MRRARDSIGGGSGGHTEEPSTERISLDTTVNLLAASSHAWFSFNCLDQHEDRDRPQKCSVNSIRIWSVRRLVDPGNVQPGFTQPIDIVRKATMVVIVPPEGFNPPGFWFQVAGYFLEPPTPVVLMALLIEKTWMRQGHQEPARVGCAKNSANRERR